MAGFEIIPFSGPLAGSGLGQSEVTLTLGFDFNMTDLGFASPNNPTAEDAFTALRKQLNLYTTRAIKANALLTQAGVSPLVVTPGSKTNALISNIDLRRVRDLKNKLPDRIDVLGNDISFVDAKEKLAAGSPRIELLAANVFEVTSGLVKINTRLKSIAALQVERVVEKQKGLSTGAKVAIGLGIGVGAAGILSLLKR